MSKSRKTLRGLAVVLDGSATLRVPMPGPERTPTRATSSSTSFRFTSLSKLLRISKKRRKEPHNKPGIEYDDHRSCTIEVYDLTRHPTAPVIEHLPGSLCFCVREDVSKAPSDAELARRYLSRWYNAKSSERGGLQQWYWEILVALCEEWDVELPQGCVRLTYESWLGVGEGFGSWWLGAITSNTVETNESI